MDVRAASYPRLAPATPSWRRDAHERHREHTARRSTVVLEAADTLDVPTGPAPAFMAQVLGQTRDADQSGLAVYAAARRLRLACGVCADERA
jgi:hypothetical protein